LLVTVAMFGCGAHPFGGPGLGAHGQRPEYPAPVPVGGRTHPVKGLLAPTPSPGLILGPAINGPMHWPQAIERVQPEAIAARLVVTPLEDLLLLDPAEAAGYLRKWRPPGLGVQRHIGYPIQWFAMAAVLLLIYRIGGGQEHVASTACCGVSPSSLPQIELGDGLVQERRARYRGTEIPGRHARNGRCFIEYAVAVRATLFETCRCSNNWLPALLKSVSCEMKDATGGNKKWRIAFGNAPCAGMIA